MAAFVCGVTASSSANKEIFLSISEAVSLGVLENKDRKKNINFYLIYLQTILKVCASYFAGFP